MTRRYALAVLAALVSFAALLGVVNLVDPAPRRVELKPDRTMVVIAAPGLRWADVSSTSYPDLWQTLDYGAIGSLNPRGGSTGTCSADAWLSISAGRGVSAPWLCANPPSPTVSGESASLNSFPGWSSRLPQIGLLADRYRTSGKCVAAVGPGAALAAADRNGRVSHYEASPSRTFDRCPLTFVDASGGSAKTSMAQLNTAFSHVPATATVVITGLSDGPRTVAPKDARLRMLFVLGNNVQHGTLWSASVRQPGVVQLADLTATALAPLGPVPAQVQGSPLQLASNKTPSASLVNNARQSDATLRAVFDLTTPFFGAWGLAGLLLGIALCRRRDRVPAWLPPATTLWAAVPIATFLAVWAPWASWPAAPVWLTVFTLLFAGAITLVAYAGRWRRSPVGPAIAVAIATWVVLALDVMHGSRLQFSALLGLQPLNGGRFYGMGNVGFALLATSALIAAGLAAGCFLNRGLERLAAATITLAGLATVTVDGWPGWGADFGGPPAVVVATAVLTLLALGIRLRPRMVVLVVLGAALVALVLAVADWLRPAPSRTHLGRFVQQVIDGEGAGVVGAKLAANVKLVFDTPFSPLVPLVLVAIIVLVARREPRLDGALTKVPFARPTLIGLLVLWAVGFAINDSGLALLLNGMGLAIALALAVAAQHLRREQDDVIRI
ncbi:hypothetical protein IEE94_08770 [Yimella sp. cx-573]|nr:hypothetical protein [Yimella sp. cx-573]